jgi:hypothetical protein
MVSPNVSRILQEAQRLSDAERKELRRSLDERSAEPSALTKEQQLDRLLLEEGVLSRIPPGPTEPDVARFEKWTPVSIQGKPLSETIIEDRR